MRQLTCRALADRRPQNGEWELCHGGLAGLFGGMTQHYVRDLMRHHPGQLGFVIRGPDGPDVHVHWTAGQGERVDFLYVHHVKRKRPLVRAGRVSRQLLPQPLDISCDRTRVGKHRHLAAHFFLRLLADFNVLFRRVLVKRSWLNPEATSRRLDNVAGGTSRAESEEGT